MSLAHSPTLRYRLRRAGPLLITLALGALAALPLFADPGFLMTRGGGDSPFLLLRLHQLLAALQAGEFPARWMPDAAYGYGFPFFSYYAALPYYFAALLRLYGFSYVAALKLTQLGALLAAAAGVYAWARVLPGAHGPALTRARAVLAAAAFTFAPFHLVNLYVRGDSLSELWAMAFYPWVLWALQSTLLRPSLGRALAVALLVGGLVFTHNISALNFMPFAGLYVLLAGWASRPYPPQQRSSVALSSRPLLIALLALAWGLGLAAFFWLPALGETSAVQIGEVTAGYFFYGNHFRSSDLIQTSLFFSPETGVDDPTPFAMGLVQAVLAGLGLLAWLWGAFRARRWTGADSFILLGLLLSTWMITPASAWVWEHLPLVRFTQFPWRFLSIQALFTAALTAHLVPAQVRAPDQPLTMKGTVVSRRSSVVFSPPAPAPLQRGSSFVVAVVAIALLAALALSTLSPLRPDFVLVRDEDVTPARLQLLEYFTANIGSTIGYEYLPRAVDPRPFVSAAVLGRPPQLKVLQGTATGERIFQRGSHQAWTVQAPEPATIALPTYFWPGWAARLDGQPVPVGPAPGLGWITLDVPTGEHTLTLTFGRTPLRAAAELASLLLLTGPLAFLLYRRRGQPPPALSRTTLMLALLLALILLFGVGPVSLILLDPPSFRAFPPPLSMDFEQLAFPHHAPVRFANGATLSSIEYSTDTPARGETVTVSSQWRSATPAEVIFELRPASNLLNAVPLVLSAAVQSLPAGATGPFEHVLPVPADIPPGLYFVTVRVNTGGQPQPALTSNGRARGLVHLAPLLIDDARVVVANESLASFGPALDLLSASLQPAGPAGARLDLLWQAAQPLPGSYLLAVRLRDVAGLEWSGLDAQAAYGFYPTHLWRPGELIPDFYGLPLVPGTPPGDYALSLALRDPATGVTLGSVDLTRPVSTTTPAGDRQPRHALTPALALTAVEFPTRIEQGDAPEVRAGWLTLAAPAANYRARWTLTPVNGAGAPPITQVLDLAPGSSPAQWPAGAYILGRVRFGTDPSLAPGLYTVSVQLEAPAGALTGQPAQLGQVEVIGRPRTFEVPPLDTPLEATFGDVLKLWGYSAEQDPASLRLTLAWGALETPGRDYKYFVHLFNLADGFVAAQADAMPRDFTYPTALWLAGEVVTDTITLPLAGLPPGQYGLAAGWYDPLTAGLPRLPAHDAQGTPLPDDRLVLPLEITVP